MKNIIKLSALIVLATTAVQANAASSGTITFNGEVTASTCDVDINGGGADATVSLPIVPATALETAGNTAGSTAFNMNLSNCSGTLTTVSAFFEAGSSVDLATGRLKNQTGTATNVSLQLRDGSSANLDVINAGNTSQVANTTYVDASSGTAILPYVVEYYAEDAATPGTVESLVTYSLQYQ